MSLCADARVASTLALALCLSSCLDVMLARDVCADGARRAAKSGEGRGEGQTSNKEVPTDGVRRVQVRSALVLTCETVSSAPTDPPWSSPYRRCASMPIQVSEGPG